MAETPAPLLVHNRIDANRRNTRLLVACFIVLILPVVWGVSELLAALVVLSFKPSPLFFLPSFDLLDWRLHTLAASFAVLVVILSISAIYLTPMFSWFLLWKAGARPLGKGWLELRQVVENLCIGAGLKPPSLYVTTSEVPNAFAVGYAHKRPSLVVSKGLLALLDRRELSGVVAHELSHIANRDTDLSTLLAAFATVARIPQKMFMGIVSILPRLASVGVSVLIVMFGLTIFYFIIMSLRVIGLLMAAWHREPTAFTGMAALMFVPAFLFLLAPVMVAFVRKTISHEREFLADADAALLTQDPEGLALALAKVSAAVGSPVSSDPAFAHMYFIDPAPSSLFSWMRGIFPTHPSADERIDLLRRMGDGIVEDLAAASEAGVNYRGEMLLRQYAPAKPPSKAVQRENDSENSSATAAARKNDGREVVHALTSQWRAGSQFQLTGDDTPLYERPDGWSRVLQTLSAGLVVTFIGFDGNFARVRTEESEGYIPRIAAAQPTTQPS